MKKYMVKSGTLVAGLALVAGLTLVLTGCEGGSSKDKDSSGVSGTWNFTLNYIPAQLILDEENGKITGTLVWNGVPATSVTGTESNGVVEIAIILQNGNRSLIHAHLENGKLVGTSDSYSTVSPAVQHETFDATRTSAPPSNGQPGGDSDLPDTGGKYITYLGEGTLPGHKYASPCSFTLGPDGRLLNNTLDDSIGIISTCSQNGSQFTMTSVAGYLTFTYNGTINGNTISGTFTVSGSDGGSAPFTATKAAETSTRPYGWVSF